MMLTGNPAEKKVGPKIGKTKLMNPANPKKNRTIKLSEQRTPEEVLTMLLPAIRGWDAWKNLRTSTTSLYHTVTK
jgi:hypothetical protein